MTTISVSCLNKPSRFVTQCPTIAPAGVKGGASHISAMPGTTASISTAANTAQDDASLLPDSAPGPMHMLHQSEDSRRAPDPAQLSSTLAKILQSHPFNHAVELMIPSLGPPSLAAPIVDDLGRRLIDGTVFQLVRDVPLSAFIVDSFLSKYIRVGQLVAIAADQFLDRSPCVPAIANGKLFLSLDKDTYEQCGLEGQESAFLGKQRYNIQINLALASFTPAKRFYQRVRWSLEEKLNQKFNFLICYTPANETADTPPVPVQVEVPHALHNTSAALLASETAVRVPYLPRMEPLTALEAKRGSDVSEQLSHIYEWIGALSHDSDGAVSVVNRPADDFVSGYAFMGPVIEATSDAVATERRGKRADKPEVEAHVSKYRWTGISSSSFVSRLVRVLSAHVDPSSLPWIAVNVWGFSDAPVAWGEREHSVQAGCGPNDFTIVLLPGNTSWVFCTATHVSELM